MMTAEQIVKRSNYVCHKNLSNCGALFMLSFMTVQFRNQTRELSINVTYCERRRCCGLREAKPTVEAVGGETSGQCDELSSKRIATHRLFPADLDQSAVDKGHLFGRANAQSKSER
jgi:hypothetical protein